MLWGWLMGSPGFGGWRKARVPGSMGEGHGGQPRRRQPVVGRPQERLGASQAGPHWQGKCCGAKCQPGCPHPAAAPQSQLCCLSSAWVLQGARRGTLCERSWSFNLVRFHLLKSCTSPIAQQCVERGPTPAQKATRAHSRSLAKPSGE